jgi:phosphoribosyl-ATP pyrophosphohydrolase
MYQFPETKFVTLHGSLMQAKHVMSEAQEMWAEVKAARSRETDMEMMDLWHSVETYFRIREREGLNVQEVKTLVEVKNDARGYYV